jgi:hypothetical protein
MVFLFGGLLGYCLVRFSYNKKKVSKDNRRGFISFSIVVTPRNSAELPVTFDYELEIEEIEKCGNKSKCKFIKINRDHNTKPEQLKFIKDSVNDSWYNEDDVVWLQKSLQEKRNEKLKIITADT